MTREKDRNDEGGRTGMTREKDRNDEGGRTGMTIRELR